MKISQTLSIVIAAALAGSAGFWLSSSMEDGVVSSGSSMDASPIQGIVLKQPRRIGVPDLSMADGRQFGRDRLAGNWNLLFYGYTNCPDICPTTLNTVAAAKKASVGFPQVVFVSVDPERDQVETVAEYARYFDEDFIGVTGDEKLLNAMAMQMSVATYIHEADESGNYLVDHSSNLMLLNPDVELVAMLRPPHSIESINKALRHVQGL